MLRDEQNLTLRIDARWYLRFFGLPYSWRKGHFDSELKASQKSEVTQETLNFSYSVSSDKTLTVLNPLILSAYSQRKMKCNTFKPCFCIEAVRIFSISTWIQLNILTFSWCAQPKSFPVLFNIQTKGSFQWGTKLAYGLAATIVYVAIAVAVLIGVSIRSAIIAIDVTTIRSTRRLIVHSYIMRTIVERC